ncbi:hypothetical protein yc1106_02461 [Curvularia clavata]|uniref:Uncharacterized protein n=1 Tax=Curvularia clavata TaxID=95742 RepID=A0A9Q9DQ32_CURCL|nr:hypothetical protein yc1106_02461 [Curvularia clavata]
MSNIPDRIVAFRIARDPDKDDKDDDEYSSSSVSATMTPTSQPKAPGPPGPPRPGTVSSTLSTITQYSSLPTITQSSAGTSGPTAASIQAQPRPADHFGPAESAGIGVGVAVAVLLLALAAWLFARRRRSSKMRKTSVSSTADTEVGSRQLDPGSKEYGPPGVKELEAGRRASELAAHMEPAEVVGDPEFVAELQGSDMPVAGWRKPDRERLFADAPINEEGDHDENGFSKFDSEGQEPGDYKKSSLSNVYNKKQKPDDHEEPDFSKMDVKKQGS